MTEPSGASAEIGAREVTLLTLRLLFWLLVACALTALLGAYFRPQGERAARAFVAAFGVGGMALGTLLADGLQFPIPPQFYMLLAVGSGTPAVLSLTAICSASVLAGCLGYYLSARASRWQWLSRKTAKERALLLRAFDRYGHSAAFVATLLPIPYSILCYLAGLNRLPRTFLLLLCVYRVPKLLGFYLLVYFGWHAG